MKVIAIEPEEEGIAAAVGTAREVVTAGAAETMEVRTARAEIVKAFIVSFLVCFGWRCG